MLIKRKIILNIKINIKISSVGRDDRRSATVQNASIDYNNQKTFRNINF